MLSASEFRREPGLQASFHSGVTLRAFDYAPPDTEVSDLQLQVVSDGPIFSLAREKIGEKRALLTQKPPSRICSIDGRASAASHLLIREFLPKAHVIVGDG